MTFRVSFLNWRVVKVKEGVTLRTSSMAMSQGWFGMLGSWETGIREGDVGRGGFSIESLDS